MRDKALSYLVDFEGRRSFRKPQVVNRISGKVNGMLTATSGNPQEVADVVLRVVETPAGQRKLRYRVSPANLGVDEINDVCEHAQARLFEAFGITADTAFVRSSTAATN